MKRSILLSFFFISVLFAQIPETISYQGLLTDQSGVIVPDNNYTIAFKLYDTLTGGTALWQETQVLAVTGGLFNVILGQIVPLGLTFSKPYYLGITVSGGDELQPRFPLTASAYSLNSVSVIDNAISTNKIQNGAITQDKLSGGLSIPPGGSAGGDLSGTYPNPTVGRIHGRTIASTAPASGQVLSWNGTQWTPSTPSSGMGGSGTANYIPKFTASTTLDNSILLTNGFGLGVKHTSPNFIIDAGLAADDNNYIRINATSNCGVLFGDPNYAYNGGISFNHANGYINFQTRIGSSFSSRMWLTKEGNLGIGTSTPSGKLHVKSTRNYAGYFETDTLYAGVEVLRSSYTGTGQYNARAVVGRSVPIDGYGYGGHFTGGYMGAYGYCEGGSSTASGYGVRGYSFGTGGPRYGVYGTTGSGSTRYGVYSSGDLGYSGGLIGPSDQKLKSNVSSLTNALQKLTQLEPKTFSYSSDARYAHMNLPAGIHYGLIAQELEKVFPEMVKDAVHPSSEEMEGEAVNYKGVTYMELIPVLIQAVKEQQQEIEELKNEIARLRR